MSAEEPDPEFVAGLAASLQAANDLSEAEILDSAWKSWGLEQQVLDGLPDTRPDWPVILSRETMLLTRRMRLLGRFPYLPQWLGGSALKISKMDPRLEKRYPQYPVPVVRGHFNALITPLLCEADPQTTD